MAMFNSYVKLPEGILMVNDTIYSIHGSVMGNLHPILYGYLQFKQINVEDAPRLPIIF